jgi:hypothetical protein
MTRGYQSSNPQVDRNTFTIAAQRRSPRTQGPDGFPSPPWIAGALIECALPEGMRADLPAQSVLEPAGGRGFMAEALRPYFRKVIVGDAYDYGYAPVRDFLTHPYGPVDWVITNPPFRLASEFIIRGWEISRVGVAMFARTQFLEGQKRR